MNKLFLFLGKSASGKDTIVKLLLEKLDIKLLKSNTTRPIRDCEIQGREYNFKSIKDFDKSYKENNILEYATYKVANGDIWIYYTLKSDLDLKNNSYIKIINPLGKSQLHGQIHNDNVCTIYISCPDDIRKARSISRGDEQKEAKRRIEQDNIDFEYLTYDYEIINDGTVNINEIVDDVINIIKEELK